MLKRLFCRHRYYEYIRTIHGEEIKYSGWKRSIWKCTKCGKIKLSNSLYELN